MKSKWQLHRNMSEHSCRGKNICIRRLCFKFCLKIMMNFFFLNHIMNTVNLKTKWLTRTVKVILFMFFIFYFFPLSPYHDISSHLKQKLDSSSGPLLPEDFINNDAVVCQIPPKGSFYIARARNTVFTPALRKK